MVYIVLLDTNFLLLPFQIPRVRLFQELDRLIPGRYKLVVLDVCLEELENLSKLHKGKRNMFLKAKEFAEKNCEVIRVDRDKFKAVDEAIVEYAKRLKAVVATNDRGLRAKLRKEGIPQVYLRGYDHLELYGEVEPLV